MCSCQRCPVKNPFQKSSFIHPEMSTTVAFLIWQKSNLKFQSEWTEFIKFSPFQDKQPLSFDWTCFLDQDVVFYCLFDSAAPQQPCSSHKQTNRSMSSPGRHWQPRDARDDCCVIFGRFLRMRRASLRSCSTTTTCRTKTCEFLIQSCIQPPLGGSRSLKWHADVPEDFLTRFLLTEPSPISAWSRTEAPRLNSPVTSSMIQSQSVHIFSLKHINR